MGAEPNNERVAIEFGTTSKVCSEGHSLGSPPVLALLSRPHQYWLRRVAYERVPRRRPLPGETRTLPPSRRPIRRYRRVSEAARWTVLAGLSMVLGLAQGNNHV